MLWKNLAVPAAVLTSLLPGLVGAQTAGLPAPVLTFKPDYVFSGSALTGWRPLGEATWRAVDGEITGRARPGGSGGWLVSDRSYSDLLLFSRLRCAAPCSSGVLIRAEKTPQGLTGVFLSLAEGDIGAYRVTIDNQGKILTRDRLQTAGGGRITGASSTQSSDRQIAYWKQLNAELAGETAASTPSPAGGAGAGPAGVPGARPGGAAGAGAAGPGGAGGGAGPGGAGGGAGPGGPGGRQPAAPPSLRAGDWNDISINVDMAVLSATLNGTSAGSGNTGDTGYGYGSIALYVGGTGELRVKDLSVKDTYVRSAAAETVSNRFRMQRLDGFYYAWDAATGDVNRDGILDVISGPYYYLGPDYTTKREIYVGQAYSPSYDYPANMVTHAHDWTGDGYADVLATEFRPMVLYVNPKGENRRWRRYEVITGISAEITQAADLDGDRVPEVVYSGNGPGGPGFYFARADPANPTAPWKAHKVSEAAARANHGVGVGDVSGDGRPDILAPSGWWEQPAAGISSGTWTFHADAFDAGRGGGGQIAVWDVNGDGLNDVVSSLAAHGFGLAWFEQQRAPDGKISFIQRTIMGDFASTNPGGVTFSQLHAGVVPADFNGDGLMDFVTGKKQWAHLEASGDPDNNSEAVLYLFQARRSSSAPGGVEFVPELIHNRSGVGSMADVADLNGDGATDVITSTVHGSFIFWGTRPTPAR